MGEAFNPVGLMLDFWTEEVPAGAAQTFKVYVINDRDTAWEGDVRLRLVKDGKSTVLQSQPCRVDPLGRTILSFTQAMPADTGKYTLVAELKDGRGTVRSLRDFRVGGP